MVWDLMALVGLLTGLPKAGCVDVGTGGFFSSFHTLSCLVMSHIPLVLALYVCISE